MGQSIKRQAVHLWIRFPTTQMVLCVVGDRGYGKVDGGLLDLQTLTMLL